MSASPLDDPDLENVGAGFIEALYRKYADNPSSVDESWQRYFAGLERVADTSGPSWQRANWPISATDDLTSALDPTQMMPERNADAPLKGSVAEAAPARTRAASVRTTSAAPPKIRSTP